MATNTCLKANITHHHTLRRRRHSIDCPPSTTFLLNKPSHNTTFSSRLATSNSLSSTTISLTTSTSSSPSQAITYDLLEQLLSSKNFRQADDETRRLLITLAGERAKKRGYIKLGWMKKLDTEVEQYNYRAFPGEFIWELSDDTPEGHLPLTNALRGTQLITCILKHPAFENDGSVDGDEDSGEGNGTISASKPFSKNMFKTNYSF